MPINVTSFDTALSNAEGTKHVLLGNGFSRALFNDIFAYDNLLNQADFSRVNAQAREAFRALNTSNFEYVMNALRDATVLLAVYGGSDPATRDKMRADADGLREVLAEVIANKHPEVPAEVSDEQYRFCRLFLANFKNIYSLNYDLLLYWTLMHDEIEPVVPCDDGFRTPEDGPEDYVTWDVENTNKQNVFYLHGALHIFDSGTELIKYTWVNTGIRLIEQIRDALARNLFPLFVAEGTSDEKKKKILHSMILSRAYRSFINIGANLFIYGVSFGESDEHLLHAIEKSKVTHLFIGIFGDPGNDANQNIIRRAEQIVAYRRERRSGKPLTLHYFDTPSARVWG